nr:M23 family metallopeptidase [Tessaracoccus coleopterorum]
MSAGLVCATVAYFAADPMTAVEAVPVPPPAPTAIASAFAARNLSGSARRSRPWPDKGRPGLIDPFNAVTPEAVGPSGVPIPLPVAPESIKQELVTSLGKATAGALLTRPVSGRTTSKFGMRFHPILKVWKLHTGLDWAVPCGTPVGAAAPGTVVKAGWAGGNGIQVKIDHGMLRGHRVVTTYNHLSSIGVRVGQKVQALDGVGRVGSTGYSTGCHMHFEVIADGQFTNPEPWLNGNPVVVDLGSMDYSTVPTPTSAPPTVRPPSPTPTPTVPTSPTPTPRRR